MHIDKNIYLYQTEAPDELYYLDNVDYVINDTVYATFVCDRVKISGSLLTVTMYGVLNLKDRKLLHYHFLDVSNEELFESVEDRYNSDTYQHLEFKAAIKDKRNYESIQRI
jgi:hypothetical protein